MNSNKFLTENTIRTQNNNTRRMTKTDLPLESDPMPPTESIAISKFFQPGKKRAREEREVGENDDVNVPGTAEEPLTILDESSSDEEVVENTRTSLQPIGSEAPGIDEPHEEIEQTTLGQSNGKEAPRSPSKKENPFACFAHNFSNVGSRKEPRPFQWRVSDEPFSAEANLKTKKPKTCDKKKDFVKMKDLPPEEQDRITKKWHSLIDPDAPLETRRFQVLVATRLHARCQGPTVRKAMKSLRDAFDEFSVQEVAKADPEILALYITNLQFYNVKAKQIVKASNEIISQFSGVVPEDQHSLLKITGVGKVFADLLAFVNTKSAHARKPQETA